MPRTGFIYSEVYLNHRTRFHPERKERLEAVVEYLKQVGIMGRLYRIKPYQATVEQLSYVHDPDYIDYVSDACARNMRSLDADTMISAESYEVARLAAGGCLAALDAVFQQEVANAFCAVRPPGHHALSSRAMGFCLFNNVAVAARYAQRKYAAERVLVIDWDVHHGNGTYDVFKEDPSVFYFSIHQYPHYPGTGHESEQGVGAGAGYSRHVTFPGGQGDAEYIAAMEDFLPQARDFRPDVVLVSAGFDAHRDDFLSAMEVTEEGFAALTRLVKGLAEECCSGRLVSVLEGGYNLEALARSVARHLEVLLEE